MGNWISLANRTNFGSVLEYDYPNIVVLLWNTPEGALVSIVELLSQDNHIQTH